MEISVILTGIGQAVGTLAKLRDAANKLKNAELKALIAELADQLSDAKLNMAELKDEIATLVTENAALRAKDAADSPILFWGCYVFGDKKEMLYCPACYDTKGKKHLTTRLNSRHRQCTVCHTLLGTG